MRAGQKKAEDRVKVLVGAAILAGAMALSSVSVVGNALRLRRFTP